MIRGVREDKNKEKHVGRWEKGRKRQGKGKIGVVLESFQQNPEAEIPIASTPLGGPYTEFEQEEWSFVVALI